MQNLRNALTRGAWAAVVIGLLAWTGCGGNAGPTRYNVAGNVTYGGQPVPAGSVTLVPDAGQGNSGPAASVPIENGHYDTSLQDVGHVGGPHIITITALDGKGDNDLFPQGMPLFPDYEMKLDLPKEDSQQDLEVPASHVAPPTSAPVGPSA